MLKEIIKNAARQLKSKSRSLESKNLLVDKPWAMIDGDFELQKLIFKDNNELILSKNGVVTVGKWEYVNAAKSILIDRGTDKLLFNAAFVNEGLLILKLDGTKDEYHVLANADIVPNLDVEAYLRRIRQRELFITEIKTIDNTVLEIERLEFSSQVLVGDRVTVNWGNPIEDGMYELPKSKKLELLIPNSNCTFIKVQNSKIAGYCKKVIKEFHGNQIEIVKDGFIYGSTVAAINGKEPLDGIYQISPHRKIKIKDGRIVDVIWNNKILNMLIPNQY